MRAPPPPPAPDQTRTARSAAASLFASALRPAASSRQIAAPEPGAVFSVPVGEKTTISAPRLRASLIQRSTIGARSTTGSSPTTTTISASAIPLSGRRKASSASDVASGRTAECAASPPRSKRPSAYAISVVSEPENAVTIEPADSRSIVSAESSASSQETSSSPFFPRRSGVVMRSSARRCG